MKKRTEVITEANEGNRIDDEAALGAAVCELLEARRALQAAEAKVEKLSRKFGPKVLAAVKKRIRF